MAFIIKSKRHPIEIHVSRILNTHIHTHMCVHIHTQTPRQLSPTFIVLFVHLHPNPLPMDGEFQPKEAVLSHNDSEHAEDLLSQLPCIGHHQSDKPKSTELTRDPLQQQG